MTTAATSVLAAGGSQGAVVTAVVPSTPAPTPTPTTSTPGVAVPGTFPGTLPRTGAPLDELVALALVLLLLGAVLLVLVRPRRTSVR